MYNQVQGVRGPKGSLRLRGKIQTLDCSGVTRVGVVSPGAATDGVTPFFSSKKLTNFLVIVSEE